MAIKAKIATRVLDAEVSGNNIDAAVSKRSIKANVTTNKIEANVATRNVEANVTTNKVVAKVVTNEIVISAVGRQGIPGPPAVRDWGYYANNVEYTGTETIIAAGTVLECTLGTNTLYRFIDGTNNANGYPIEDSFYDDFDGVNLTNLIATRGV